MTACLEDRNVTVTLLSLGPGRGDPANKVHETELQENVIVKLSQNQKIITSFVNIRNYAYV